MGEKEGKKVLLEYMDTPAGIAVPRITSLINLFASFGLVEEYVTKGKVAGEEGTLIHDIVNRIDHGESIATHEWYSYPEGVRNAVKAFIRWKKDTGFKPKMSEITVYSLKHGIGGHLDSIGLIDRRVALCDWKSGEIDNERVRLQLAAYGFCYLEMYPRRTVSGFSAVHLNKKTGLYKHYVMLPDEADQYFQTFLDYKAQIGVI